MRQITGNLPVMDAVAAANTNGTVLLVEDYDTIILSFATASSANLTVKAQGSIAKDAPTWANAQSPSNQWDYVQMKDLEDASSVDGDTGFAVSGTDDHRQFEVNVNGLRWLNLRCTARSAGSVTVTAKGFSRGGA